MYNPRVTLATLALPLFLLVAGFVAGLYASNVGGGALVCFPALLFVGMPTPVAIATNRFVAVFLEGSSALQFGRKQSLDARLAFYVGTLAAVGSFLGARIVGLLSVQALDVIVAVCLLLVLLILLLHPRLGAQEGTLRTSRKSFLGIIAFLLGIYGGFFGAGFGTFIMIALAWSGLSLRQSAPVARSVGFLMSLVAMLSFASFGSIRYFEGGVLAVGCVAGSWLGVKVSAQRSNAYIRALLTFVIILSAGQLLWRALG